MSEPSESLLLLEEGGLDINENLPKSQDCSFSNEEPLFDSAPSIICRESDSAFMETSNNSETSVGCIKSPEFSSEEPLNNNDINNSGEFTSNQKTDSGIHDSENNVVENIKLIEFGETEQNLSENSGVIISDFNFEENEHEFKDEEFHDAVQFFKDPSSLKFLENAGSSSAPSEPSMVRSSLYQKFDPLHAKFFSQSNELQEITEDEPEIKHDILENVSASDNLQTGEPDSSNSAVLVEVTSSEPQNNLFPDTREKDTVPAVVNKHLSQVSPRQSLGNILISFDSPVINKGTNDLIENVNELEPPKLYTEEEMQQTLKIQELTIQETVLKKQQELEESFLKRQQELEAKLDQHKCLSNSLYNMLKEVVNLVYVFSDNEKQLKAKLEMSEKENNKLKEDLKTSVEDIQSVETTFSDFHKRYEQCKNMLKVYTENEKSLKQQLESMNLQLHEKDEMYKALQTRTQEMLDKANSEVSNVKKAGDAQVAVLKAQLKKAELKISSLESDVKHVKIENGKLSSICDELMAKVSET